MSTLPESDESAAEWQELLLLYPLYCALDREFVIEFPRCSDLEGGVEAPTQESVEQAQQWFADMDQRIQVHQLRQFLQTTTLTSENGLRAMLQHYLGKLQRSSSDRDKIDFLLVQFFSHCAPSRLEDEDVGIAYVAQVLEPIFSTGDFSAPDSALWPPFSVPEWPFRVRFSACIHRVRELGRAGVPLSLEIGHHILNWFSGADPLRRRF